MIHYKVSYRLAANQPRVVAVAACVTILARLRFEQPALDPVTDVTGSDAEAFGKLVSAIAPLNAVQSLLSTLDHYRISGADEARFLELARDDVSGQVRIAFHDRQLSGRPYLAARLALTA